MQTISEIRRANIRALINERGGLTKLSRLLGYKNPSFLSQMISLDNPTREVTEKTARGIEEAMVLPTGYLDRAPDAVAPSLGHEVERVKAPAAPTANVPAVPTAKAVDQTQRMIDAVRVVGTAMKDAGMVLEPDRFAEIVALVYADAPEGGVRPEIVRMMLKLLR